MKFGLKQQFPTQRLKIETCTPLERLLKVKIVQVDIKLVSRVPLIHGPQTRGPPWVSMGPVFLSKKCKLCGFLLKCFIFDAV
jgi:hypothetical protein